MANLPRNLAILGPKSKNIFVIDPKSKNISAIDTKSKDISVLGETTTYMDSRTLKAGMPIPFGGAFNLTYPTDITVNSTRL